MYTKIFKWKDVTDIVGNYRLCYVKRVVKHKYDNYGYEVYEPSNKEHLKLFFTNCDLKHQWGDDWDDAPYNDNAGIPYDEHKEGGEWVCHEIIVLEVELNKTNDNGDCYYYQLPEDFSYNCPFSVEMINAGVIAWITISSDSQLPLS